MGKTKIIALLFAFIISLAAVGYYMISWTRNVAEDKVVSSSQASQKLKSALLGNGVIEMTTGEANSLIDSMVKNNLEVKERVKEIYINIIDEKFELNAISYIFGKEFFISSLVKPVVADKSLKLYIDRISVGKVTIPKGVFLFLAKRYLPEGIRISEDGAIDIGNKFSSLDMKSISVSDNKLKIQLNDVQIVSQKVSKGGGEVVQGSNIPSAPDNGASAVSEIPAQPKTGNQISTNVEKPNTSDTTIPNTIPNNTQPVVNPETEKTVEMLKETNAQLNDVLNDVKDARGKDWVNSVIAVNTKMINNPNGDYTKDINSAKAVYKKLPAATRNQVKSAALANMNVSAVRYLVKVYGI